MKVVETKIKGLLILEPRVFKDDRGEFCETFNETQFNEAVGVEIKFVQDNQSTSKKGVLRGLHFQNPPFAQAKLVRVIKGAALDIAVDIRRGSPTYGQYVSILLSEENNLQFYVPKGFAHGFVAMEENTIFAYKCSNFYHPDSEGCIKWDDPKLNIDWQIVDPIVSEKDFLGEDFTKFVSKFY